MRVERVVHLLLLDHGNHDEQDTNTSCVTLKIFPFPYFVGCMESPMSVRASNKTVVTAFGC